MSKSRAPFPLTPAVMHAALEAYDRAILELVHRNINPTERVRTALARTIVELAEHGNHNSTRLKNAALARFKRRG